MKSMARNSYCPGTEVRLGWISCKLRDLCREDRQIVEVGSPDAAKLPYLGLEDIESTTGRILAEPLKISATAGQSTTFRFNPQHVLYGKLRPYLNKVALPSFTGRCTTELIPLLPLPHASRELVALLLRRPQTVSAAMQGVTGSRMPRANLDEVLGQVVIIPSAKDEQDSLAANILSRLSAIQHAQALCREQVALLQALERRTIEQMDIAGQNGDGGAH
jgi:hypothetical protein